MPAGPKKEPTPWNCTSGGTTKRDKQRTRHSQHSPPDGPALYNHLDSHHSNMCILSSDKAPSPPAAFLPGPRRIPTQHVAPLGIQRRSQAQAGTRVACPSCLVGSDSGGLSSQSCCSVRASRQASFFSQRAGQRMSQRRDRRRCSHRRAPNGSAPTNAAHASSGQSSSGRPQARAPHDEITTRVWRISNADPMRGAHCVRGTKSKLRPFRFLTQHHQHHTHLVQEMCGKPTLNQIASLQPHTASYHRNSRPPAGAHYHNFAKARPSQRSEFIRGHSSWNFVPKTEACVAHYPGPPVKPRGSISIPKGSGEHPSAGEVASSFRPQKQNQEEASVAVCPQQDDHQKQGKTAAAATVGTQTLNPTSDTGALQQWRSVQILLCQEFRRTYSRILFLIRDMSSTSLADALQSLIRPALHPAQAGFGSRETWTLSAVVAV